MRKEVIGDAELYCGDVRACLAEIADESVQCCVTSPPYWGLRDYGTARWDGGDAGCDHVAPSNLNASFNERWGNSSGDRKQETNGTKPYRTTCGKCGATRIDAQIGLEATPEAYVETLVGVFREVRRVLRQDGVCWLNLGDSYANTGKSGGGAQGERWQRNGGRTDDCAGTFKYAPPGLKPKDLVMIPARVALALQADAWYLRSDIIWAKRAPMPESVTDRPTSAHEHIFLLSKAATYYYDADAVRETTTGSRRLGVAGYSKRAEAMGREPSGNGKPGVVAYGPDRANMRNVWHLGPDPYPDAHFATFPRIIPERCISAGSKPGDVVLDPFLGSGTTGEVAVTLGRKFIGIELSAEYMDTLAKPRIDQSQRQGRMFA